MSKYSTIRPFQAYTAAAHQFDDLAKPGRQVDFWQWWWIRVLHSDFSDADTSQALDLDALADTLVAANSPRVSGAIPDDALFGYWTFDLREVFAGGVVSAATLIQGISGTTNGHLTSTDVFTGAALGRKRTSGATLWSPRPLASAPLLQLDTTTGNINTLTQGCIDVFARFSLDPASQYFAG